MSKWLNIQQYKKISRFLGKKVLWLFTIGLGVGLAAYIIEVAFAYGLQSFLIGIGVMEKSVVHLPPFIPQGELAYILLFFLGIGSTRCLLQWLQLYLQGLTSEELRFLQRTRLLHWAFHSESVSSSQITILMNDRTNSTSALVQSLQIVIVQFTCGILLGFSLFYMSPGLTLVCALALSILLLPIRSFDKKISVSARGLTSEGEKINRQLLNSVKNLLLMHIYGTQKFEEEKAQSRNALVRSYHLIYYSNNAWKFALPQFVGLILICMIAFVAKSHLGMTPGKLLSYFYLFVRFLQTISAAAQAMSPVVQQWPQLGELARWWADHSYDGIRNPEKIVLENAEVLPPGPIGWRVRDVNFSYPNAPEAIFKDLNLMIEPGKCLAVTGPSGAGKSTLVQLLLGGAQPQQGNISLVFNNGQERALTVARQHLLKSVGYVGAESFLIEGTIYENLIYGLRHEPKPEQVREACKKAECQFIFEMPNGLEHYLTEQGQGLSAGQKQRVSLARALLRDPTVLILDEATANLDLDTEQKLVETLAQLKGEMTILAITHRQALLKIADEKLNLGTGHP